MEDKEKQSPKYVIDRILSLDIKDRNTGEVLYHFDDIDKFSLVVSAGTQAEVRNDI